MKMQQKKMKRPKVVLVPEKEHPIQDNSKLKNQGIRNICFPHNLIRTDVKFVMQENKFLLDSQIFKRIY